MKIRSVILIWLAAAALLGAAGAGLNRLSSEAGVQLGEAHLQRIARALLFPDKSSGRRQKEQALAGLFQTLLLTTVTPP